MTHPGRIGRRDLFTRTLAAGAGLGLVAALRPRISRAQTPVIDPYIGTIPLAFPVVEGSYQTPLNNNWHASRQAERYSWNHRNGPDLRAHDGIDIYPLADALLPPVYAPLVGRVAAVAIRAENRLDAPLTYQVSSQTPPPWDYSTAADAVENLPLYCNFIWLISTDPATAGYFVLLAHLQTEPLIEQLVPDQPVSVGIPLGMLGDTGNAAGVPQLHVELHYPVGERFSCAHCSPVSPSTALDPYASLVAATRLVA